MSFLDNLENNLKAMEALEPGGLDDSKRRETDRKFAVAIAPWAERLKSGPFVSVLMRDLTRAGFQRRMKVNFVWIGRTLRLEAAGERLDLEPVPEGVDAVFPDRRVRVDLDGSPDPLVQEWLQVLDRKLSEQAAQLAELPAEIDDDETEDIEA